MNLIITIGEISFCFANKNDIITSYFPNACYGNVVKPKQMYYIKPSGKFKGQILNRQYLEVENFLGAKYRIYYDGAKKYLVSINNLYGDHVFVEFGNTYEVYSLDDSPNNDVIWSIRLCRELILNYYLEKGYVPLHSSAMSFNNSGVLSIGEKRAGKTTTLCSLVGKGANVLSNDLALVGINENNEVNVIGWPWKITIGNAIAQKLGLETNVEEPKVELLPSEFCSICNCVWKWESSVKIILFPNISLNQAFTIKKANHSDAKSTILNFGIEYYEITNIFNGKKHKLNFEPFVSKIAHSIPCYSIYGNIWENADKIKKMILEEIYEK